MRKLPITLFTILVASTIGHSQNIEPLTLESMVGKPLDELPMDNRLNALENGIDTMINSIQIDIPQYVTTENNRLEANYRQLENRYNELQENHNKLLESHIVVLKIICRDSPTFQIAPKLLSSYSASIGNPCR